MHVYAHVVFCLCVYIGLHLMVGHAFVLQIGVSIYICFQAHNQWEHWHTRAKAPRRKAHYIFTRVLIFAAHTYHISGDNKLEKIIQRQCADTLMAMATTQNVPAYPTSWVTDACTLCTPPSEVHIHKIWWRLRPDQLTAGSTGPASLLPWAPSACSAGSWSA